MAVDVSALGEVVLDDSEGVAHRLGDLWAEQAVVLNFLRHFG